MGDGGQKGDQNRIYPNDAEGTSASSSDSNGSVGAKCSGDASESSASACASAPVEISGGVFWFTGGGGGIFVPSAIGFGMTVCVDGKVL